MREQRYIVVDEDNRPMAFEDDQFCYVSRVFKGKGRPSPINFQLKSYTKKETERLIQQTIDYRTSNGFEVTEYHLMEISELTV